MGLNYKPKSVYDYHYRMISLINDESIKDEKKRYNKILSLLSEYMKNQDHDLDPFLEKIRENILENIFKKPEFSHEKMAKVRKVVEDYSRRDPKIREVHKEIVSIITRGSSPKEKYWQLREILIDVFDDENIEDDLLISSGYGIFSKHISWEDQLNWFIEEVKEKIDFPTVIEM